MINSFGILGDIAAVFNGKTPSKEQQRETGHPVLKIRDVSEYGSFKGKFDSFVDVSLALQFSGKFLKPGDTLILNAAHNADYVGSKTYRAAPEVTDALPTGEWLVIRPDIAVLHSGYANHWINSPNAKRLLRDMVKGIHLYPKDVARLPIPLPPLAEQRRIAAILDAADALRQKRRQALRLLDQLSQSIFIEMFGDVEANDWPMGTVQDVAAARAGSLRTGPFGSQLLHSEFVDKGIAVIGIDNAVTNQFSWGEKRHITVEKYRDLARYTVHPGDVLITIMGTCGRCAVVPDDIPTAISTKHLCCITLDPAKCLPEFLHAYFLRHPLARSYLGKTAKGAIMDGLNMGIIREMPIPMPPIGLQRDFSNRQQAVQSQIEICRASLQDFDALFASLQHRAFRGEL
jgi:type I restriction enzyme, S subunit